MAPPGAGQAGKPLAPRPKNPWPGALVWGALGPGPLARKTLGLRPFGLGGPWLWKWGASLEWGTLGSEPLGVGGPWPGGPWLGAKSLLGGPCLQLPLVQIPSPWPGGCLARAGGPWPWEALGAGWPWGPLVRGGWSGPWPGAPGPRGALGPGGPWPRGPLARGALGPGALAGRKSPKSQEKPQNHEIEQPACLDPLASLLVQESSHQGPGGPGQGVPANPEPKTLNRPPEAKGYDLGLYFSYAKGGLGAGHPLAEY